MDANYWTTKKYSAAVCLAWLRAFLFVTQECSQGIDHILNKATRDYNRKTLGKSSKLVYYCLNTLHFSFISAINIWHFSAGCLAYFTFELSITIHPAHSPPSAFRTSLILHGSDLMKCLKHSQKILGNIDKTASCSCCRLVGCTFMM